MQPLLGQVRWAAEKATMIEKGQEGGVSWEGKILSAMKTTLDILPGSTVPNASFALQRL
jgi:capsid protein